MLFEINYGHKYPGLFDIIETGRSGAKFITHGDFRFQKKDRRD